jgi:PAS fold
MTDRHLSRIMQALDRSSAVAYMLNSEFRIMYVNPAWNRFAEANGASKLISQSVIGSDLFALMTEVLRPFYSDAFRQVMATGRVWEKTYECSSSTLFRMFRMRIHLVKPQDWFAVTNALVVERSHTRVMWRGNPNEYMDANGFVTVCAHCRCTRHVNNLDRWDFVPEYVEPALNYAAKVSHGLCPVCCAYFYGPES